MANVILVHTDNWEGLYIKNKLVHQGHTIGRMQLLLYIKTKFPGNTTLNEIIPDVFFADQEWLDERGTYPKDFKDVKIRF